MIAKDDLLKKIEEVNDVNKKLFEEIGLSQPNLIFSYDEDKNMVLAETFSYGPEGRKSSISEQTPDEFFNTFNKN